MGEKKLWKVDMDMATPGKPALYWAIEHKDFALAEKALAMYAEFLAPGLIDGTVVRWDTFTWRDGTPADERPSPPVILAVESGCKSMLELVLVKTLAAGCGLDARCERTEGVEGGTFTNAVTSSYALVGVLTILRINFGVPCQPPHRRISASLQCT